MVTQSVMRSAEALQKTVRDERYATKAAGAEFGLVYIHWGWLCKMNLLDSGFDS